MGGESIKKVDSGAQALLAPGEILIFDPHGKLRVQDESLDIDYFRRYTVPKQDTGAGSTSGGGGGLLPGEGRPPPRGRGSRDS